VSEVAGGYLCNDSSAIVRERIAFCRPHHSCAVFDAFATVPRESVCWSRTLANHESAALGDYWTTADANPCHVYHDAPIALDETRSINNGQPSLWPKLFDELNLCRAATVVHVGAGTGYDTAILAEIVGPASRVIAIETGESSTR
jgi:protein-L-isoaspartate(D-aspartate) O-methyltransferase